jgi:hypothetical protein
VPVVTGYLETNQCIKPGRYLSILQIILENPIEREKDVQSIDLDSVMRKKRAAFRWSPYW